MIYTLFVMKTFSNLAKKLKKLLVQKAGESITVNSVHGGRRGLLAALIAKENPGPLLAIVPEEKDVPFLIKDIRLFSRIEKFNLEVVTIPAYALEERMYLWADIKRSAQKMKSLFTLTFKKESTVLVLSAKALMQKTVPKEIIKNRTKKLSAGSEIEREELIEQLISMGYQRSHTVEQPSEFAVRGGIVDIFSPSESMPYRIELTGDTIESIKIFSHLDQRSIKTVQNAVIIPACEAALDKKSIEKAADKLKNLADKFGVPHEKRRKITSKLADSAASLNIFLPAFYDKLVPVTDYFPSASTALFFEPEEIKKKFKEFYNQTKDEEREARKNNDLFFPISEITADEQTLQNHLSNFSIVNAFLLSEEQNAVDLGLKTLPVKAPKISPKLKPSAMADFLSSLSTGKVMFVFSSESQKKRFLKMLSSLHESESTVHIPLQAISPQRFIYETGNLSSGFIDQEDDLAVVSESDLFGTKKRARPKRTHFEEFLDISTLKEGDPVVHIDHGIGLYRGLKRMTIGGIESDFCIIEYAGNDRLFLPPHRLNLLQKYIGSGGKPPKPDKLGGGRWEKAKRAAGRAAEEMAKELLELYAYRKTAKGFSFSEPDEIFAKFEAEFPFQETPDQERAIAEVLSDMQDEKPMDRLVCGDVGFGKTEVAVRAAMLAVLGGKQAAVLVPTTVLAQQHFQTFTSRMAEYPVKIEVLSRFKTKSQQKKIIEDLAKGKIDIIIGTHRLLSKDVKFADLGLLVLDEEHRFGVRHKEKIQQIKKSIDVLTLTATPIPRTLQMSMTALRDLSIINTPPTDRRAVVTAVARFDEKLIKNAVQREIKRNGQIFFVHNRVESIYAMESYLKRLLPSVKIKTAHGKMKSEDLEKVMMEFMEHKFDLLLCTAIIESGLDIPNANTLIVDRADKFGLAQLYQLRGRVGRSTKTAYAYFLVPSKDSLSKDAQKRLAALREFTALGSGFKIALHDLEIRGGGHLLGHKQSGHLHQVGFEMYCRLLDRAIQKLKGEKVDKAPDPEISLPLAAFIPEDYLPDATQRLILYKRLSQAETEERLKALSEEMQDRFGPIPKPVEKLIKIISLKISAKKLGISRIEAGKNTVNITFSNSSPLNPEKLISWMNSKGASLSPEGKLSITATSYTTEKILNTVKDLLKELSTLV